MWPFWEKGKWRACLGLCLGPRTTLRSNSLGWESGLQGQSSWRAGVHFCSNPGLLCFKKKKQKKTKNKSTDRISVASRPS